jgi:hypothetical protein
MEFIVIHATYFMNIKPRFICVLITLICYYCGQGKFRISSNPFDKFDPWSQFQLSSSFHVVKLYVW